MPTLLQAVDFSSHQENLAVTTLLSEILQIVLAYYMNWQQNIAGARTNYEDNQICVRHVCFPALNLLLSSHHNTLNKNSVNWFYAFIPSLSHLKLHHEVL